MIHKLASAFLALVTGFNFGIGFAFIVTGRWAGLINVVLGLALLYILQHLDDA
jgi:hypothetical protein